MKKGPSPWVRRAKCSVLRTAMVAVQTTTAILATSEGWKRYPTSSQRRAPFTSGANASVPGRMMNTSMATDTAMRGQASRAHQR